MCIDHINHNPFDNRIANLREVSQHENTRNASLSKNNKSGVCGVSWHAECNKWCVGIGVVEGGKSKSKYLGVFDDLADAISARRLAERQYGYHPNHGVVED